jgi:protein gp37
VTDTKISWTGRTWNPVTGCDKVSPGCTNCYALTQAGRLKRMGQPKYQADGDPRTSGPGFGVTLHPGVLDEPLRWRKPQLVFVCSMSDLFHQGVPDGFIACVWDVMGQAGQHTFQVLTKRPHRMASIAQRFADIEQPGGLGGGGLPPMPRGPEAVRATYTSGRAHLFAAMLDDMGAPPEGCAYPLYDWAEGWRWWPLTLPNVHLGVSIESDRYAFRADQLRAAPAAVRWLSLEPLLGPLPSLSFEGVDWVVIGGESGHGARSMELEWAADLVDRAHAAGCRVHVKQLGTVLGKRLGIGHHDLELFPVEVRVREDVA